MAWLFGIITISRASQAGTPGWEQIYPLEWPIAAICHDPALGIQLRRDPAGQQSHGILVCSERADRRISLINTGQKRIELRYPAAQTPGDADQNGARVLVGASQWLDIGHELPLGNDTRIIIDDYTLTLHLTPLVAEPLASESIAPQLNVSGPIAQPIDDLALASSRELTQLNSVLPIVPGSAQRLALTVSSSSNIVQRLSLPQIVPEQLPGSSSSGAQPLRLPTWITWDRQARQIQATRTSQDGSNITNYFIDLRPPRRTSTAAGFYRLRADFITQTLRAAPKTHELLLIVLPYLKLEAHLQVKKVAAFRRGAYIVRVKNESNWTVPISLELQSEDERLALTARRRLQSSAAPRAIVPASAAPPQDLAPGECGEWLVTATPRGRWPFGATRAYRFTVLVQLNTELREGVFERRVGSSLGARYLQRLIDDGDRSAEPLKLDAELEHRRIPYWTLLLALLLIAIVVALGNPEIPRTIANSVRRYRPVAAPQSALTTSTLLSGQVMPGGVKQISFPVAGTVEQLNVPAECQPSVSVTSVGGCRFETESVVAKLDVTPFRARLAELRLELAAAEAALTVAEDRQRLANAKAALDLDYASRAAERLSPNGSESALKEAQDRLKTVQEEFETTRNRLSQETAEARLARAQATTDLLAAQRTRDEAFRKLHWVMTNDTHPTEQYMVGGVLVLRPITEAERQEFLDATDVAELEWQKAEAAAKLAEANLSNAEKREAVGMQQAERTLAEALQALQAVASGGTDELAAADQAVRAAELNVDSVQLQNIEALGAALDAATAALAKLREGFGFVFTARLDDLAGVEAQIAEARRLAAARGWETTADVRLAIVGVDELALYADQHVAAKLTATVKAGTTIAQSHVAQGAQVEANAPVVTVYGPVREVNVVASIEQDQIAELSAATSISVTTVPSGTVAASLALLPSQFDAAGLQVSEPQTITLRGDFSGIPLFTPATVTISRATSAPGTCAVPARAVFSDDGGDAIDVRRPVVGNFALDRRFAIRVISKSDQLTQIAGVNGDDPCTELRRPRHLVIVR